MEDTSSDIAEKMREMMREKTPIERLKMGFSMNETSRYLVTRFILENNPNISELDFKKELFLKYYGIDFSSVERDRFFAHLERIYKS